MKLYKYTYEGLLNLMNERFLWERRDDWQFSFQVSACCITYADGRTFSFKVYTLTLPKSVHVYHGSLCFGLLRTVNKCTKLQVLQAWKSKHFYWTICTLPINIIKYSILLNNRAKIVTLFDIRVDIWHSQVPSVYIWQLVSFF